MTDTSSNVNFTRLGSGVSNLNIVTNNAGNADVLVATLVSGIHLRVDTGSGTNNDITLGTSSDIIEDVVVKTGAGNCIVNVRDHDVDAIVDFGSGGLGLGNELYVEGPGEATITPVDGSHVVFVDYIEAHAGGATAIATVTVASDATIDDFLMRKFALLRVADSATINSGTTEFHDVTAQGVLSVEAPSTIGTLTNDGTATFTASSTSTVTEFKVSATDVEDATGTVNVNSSAQVTALTTSRVGALNITDSGKFTLQQRPQPPMTNNAHKLIVKSLFMGNDPSAPSGQLDLKDNAMIVDFISSPFDNTIKPLIVSGYAAGAWTGNGIRSSIAAGMSNTGVGYAGNFELGLTSFEGIPVDSTSLFLKYTYYGDANLTGNVNLADFNILADNFGESPRNWAQGDFNYDFLVNLQDFNRLAANFGSSGLSPMGGEEYTVDDLLGMLMERYPEYF